MTDFDDASRDRSTQYPEYDPYRNFRPPDDDYGMETEREVPAPEIWVGPYSSEIWVGPFEDPRRYVLTSNEPIGGGVEGSIYRANFIGQGGGNPTPVAVKEYLAPRGGPSSWPHDGTWLQINDQANLLRSLPESRHLVKIREVILGARSSGAADLDPARTAKEFQTPFLIMEWVDGESPEEILARGPVALSTRLGWLSDLAEAVDQLHSLTHTFENPLVHGDIKPANCLISETRGLVLLDTGAVHRADRAGNRRGLVTPAFAAPEVRLDPWEPRTEATDYFSLAAVAFSFLTGQRLPDSQLPHFLEDTRAILRSGDWLSHCRDDEDSELACDLVMTLLASEPRDRTAMNAPEWAARLTQLAEPAPRSLRSRATVLSAAGLVVVILTVVTVLVIGKRANATAGECATPDSAGTTAPSASAGAVAGDNDGGSLDWNLLGSFDGAGGRTLYSQSFDDASDDWPADDRGSISTRYVCSEYEAHVSEGGQFLTLRSPDVVSRSDEVVTATASMTGGQGGWGVWCRGTDRDGSERYDFLITHAGAVTILEPGGTGTGWVYLSGVDVSAPTTISARCADVPGAPVELTLAVNGRQVLTYQPTGTLLGPGYAGIGEFSFSDVAGPTLTARFGQFDIGIPP